MKKLVCLLIALMLCCGAVMPVAAETTEFFIPSYGLNVLEATVGDEDVKDCVVVTCVTEAIEKTTDITQEERDLLIELYNGLSDKTLELPVEGKYQYVDMMDISFANEACREQEGHDHMKDEKTGLTIKFELEIESEGTMKVMAYIDGEWETVTEAARNDDGTVTITFEEICPVAILTIEPESEDEETDPEDKKPGYRPGEIGFVPSISYKETPEVKDASMNIDGKEGQGVEECIVVTNIVQAEEQTTDISDDDRKLLLEVYEKLMDGEMVLPLEGEYVIRELVNVTFKYEECREVDEHGEKLDNLKKKGVTLTITFDMDLNKDDEITVLSYVDGEWIPAEKVVNNGDGTLLCVFEDICPIAFVNWDSAQAGTTESAEAANASAGGVAVGGAGNGSVVGGVSSASGVSSVGIWAATGICSMAAIAAIVTYMIRSKKREMA